MNDREADLRAELADRAYVEPPEQSGAELARRNAARTSVTIESWRKKDYWWDVATLSCGHEVRVPSPFGQQHAVGTRVSCEWCRHAKLKETP